MPRRARLAAPGIPWHVVQRGNNRSACFFSAADYAFYLALLQEQARKFGCAVHAYVLMTNHVHLLLTPETERSVGQVMKNLGQRYVQRINKAYGRSGTLWEGRFKSCLIADQGYLLTCCRYIEKNPVRAGMVAHPREYPWSSYRCNAEGKDSALLKPHPVYLELGSTREARCRQYQVLFEERLEAGKVKEIRRATFGNLTIDHANERGLTRS